VYLTTYLSVCLFIYLSVCLFIYLSVYISISLSVCLSIYLSICIPCEPWSLFQSVGLLGRGISPSQGHYLHTEQHKRTQTSMPRVAIEPTTPVFERSKTVHALDHVATVIGISDIRASTLVTIGVLGPKTGLGITKSVGTGTYTLRFAVLCI
jgi:hypothetical protein